MTIIVRYVAICLATGEVITDPVRYEFARLAADMETIVRHDAMPDRGFATPEECDEAVAAATFTVTPAALV